jgi:prepilin-type processing-associated H-X9-DG protein
VSGEIRCSWYNHYYPPNSPLHHCISNLPSGPPDRLFTSIGWRGARSRHSGGVNVLWNGGGMRFMSNTVQPDVWRAVATRAGGEVVSGNGS